MRPAAEFTCFASVALLAHVAIWAGFASTGSEAAGAEGEAVISLQAASGELSDLVEAWERPVEAVQQLDAPQPPSATAMPEMILPQSAPAPDQLAVLAPEASMPPTDLPEVETQPPPRALTQAPALAPTMAQPDVPLPEPMQRAEPPVRPEPLPERQAVASPLAPSTPSAPPDADTESLRPPVMEAAPRTSLRPQTRPDRTTPQPQRPARQAPAQQAQPPQPPAPAQTTTSRSQSTGAAPQTAAGRNEGTNAGRATQERPATLSRAARQSLMAQWGASIRNRVERRKSYPRGTTASGTTVVRITVSSTGGLASVSVARSSGSRELDQAAIQAVRRARFPAAPKGLGPGQFQFNLPLAFSRR